MLFLFFFLEPFPNPKKTFSMFDPTLILEGVAIFVKIVQVDFCPSADCPSEHCPSDIIVQVPLLSK